MRLYIYTLIKENDYLPGPHLKQEKIILVYGFINIKIQQIDIYHLVPGYMNPRPPCNSPVRPPASRQTSSKAITDSRGT